MPYESTLVDDIPYAEPSDVEPYIRNKSFDATSDPTETQVQQLLDQASNRIDLMTGRAWRTRRVENVELQAEFSREQRGLSYRQRRRGAGHSSHKPLRRGARRSRASVFLPHIELQSWDLNATPVGDTLEILGTDVTEDISANEGRGESGDFVLDEQSGILYVDLGKFATGPLRGRGELREPALVRVTYRYGKDESGSINVSVSVPPDIKEACAKMVAADLMRTDQYGSLIASGPEDAPSQTDAASAMWSGAMDVISRRTRRQLV